MQKSHILAKKRYFSKTGLQMSKIHQGFTVKVAWGRKGALFSKKCAFCAKVHISVISSFSAKKAVFTRKVRYFALSAPHAKNSAPERARLPNFCTFLRKVHIFAKYALFAQKCTFCEKVLFSRKSAIFTKKCNFSEMDPKMSKIH